MARSLGRVLALSAGVLLIWTLGVPGPASGQVLAVGGQVSMNRDIAADNTWGVGARGYLRLPLTGITLQGTADFYSPYCGTLECDLREVGLNLLWSLPVPFVANPYFGAGLAVRYPDGSWAELEDSDYGVNFLAGIVLQGARFQRFRPFVEVKYQGMQDFDAQTVFSGGILLKIF
jgi:hypothetical protein